MIFQVPQPKCAIVDGITRENCFDFLSRLSLLESQKCSYNIHNKSVHKMAVSSNNTFLIRLRTKKKENIVRIN